MNTKVQCLFMIPINSSLISPGQLQARIHCLHKVTHQLHQCDPLLVVHCRLCEPETNDQNQQHNVKPNSSPNSKHTTHRQLAVASGMLQNVRIHHHSVDVRRRPWIASRNLRKRMAQTRNNISIQLRCVLLFVSPPSCRRTAVSDPPDSTAS